MRWQVCSALQSRHTQTHTSVNGNDHTVQVAKAMPRLVENPADRLPPDSPIALSLGRVWSKGDKGFFQLITENNDTPKQVTDIIKGVTNIVMKVQAVLNDMESKYKKIWDTDKTAYMRRYRRNLESRNFDADIKVYLDHIDEIRAEESTINLEFLHLDQQPIKAVRRFLLLADQFTLRLAAAAHACTS